MKREAWLALAILAAAAVLRVAFLAGWPLWLDESWSRWMAERDWAALGEAAARYDTHPPFYYALLKLWLGVAGATPLSLRLPSIAAGVAMVPLAWLAARELRLPAWLAAALVAASPALVIASRQARPYALFASAFAIALWAALRLLRSRERRIWLAYGLALEAALWLHSLGALFAAALAGSLLIAFALKRMLRAQLLPFLAVHALIGLAWLPAFLTLLEQRRVWTHTWLRFSAAAVPDGLAQGLAAPGATAIFVFVLAALGAGALLRESGRRPAAILLLVTALGPALATIVLSFVSTPVFLPRTLVPSVLPLLLLAAAGIASLKKPFFECGAAAFALVLLAMASAFYVASPPEERWYALSHWLDAHVRPGDEVWLMPNELSLPLGYARGGAPLGVPVEQLPAPFPAPDHPGPRYSGTLAVPGMTGADAARTVADAEARHVRGLWVITRFSGLFDPEDSLRRRLGSERRRLRDTSFAPLVIEYYALAPAPTPPPG
jgi:mannosyltransferase